MKKKLREKNSLKIWAQFRCVSGVYLNPRIFAAISKLTLNRQVSLSDKEKVSFKYLMFSVVFVNKIFFFSSGCCLVFLPHDLFFLLRRLDKPVFLLLLFNILFSLPIYLFLFFYIQQNSIFTYWSKDVLFCFTFSLIRKSFDYAWLGAAVVDLIRF